MKADGSSVKPLSGLFMSFLDDDDSWFMVFCGVRAFPLTAGDIGGGFEAFIVGDRCAMFWVGSWR